MSDRLVTPISVRTAAWASHQNRVVGPTVHRAIVPPHPCRYLSSPPNRYSIARTGLQCLRIVLTDEVIRILTPSSEHRHGLLRCRGAYDVVPHSNPVRLCGEEGWKVRGGWQWMDIQSGNARGGQGQWNAGQDQTCSKCSW